MGSVIPVRNEVNAAESSSPATRFLFSGGRVVHRQTRAEQTKHHGNKAPGHEARRALIEMLHVRIGKLGEDPLRALNGDR